MHAGVAKNTLISMRFKEEVRSWKSALSLQALTGAKQHPAVTEYIAENLLQ